MPKSSEWNDFEKLIYRIQQQTADNAVVEHNRIVIGKSGRKRQLDISISQKIGLHEVLIVLECKRYKRPVDIQQVEAFATKLRDVKANHGIIVSQSGFSDGAIAIARDNSITLHNYREAQERDWSQVMGPTSWLNFVCKRATIVSAIAATEAGIIKLAPDSRLYHADEGTGASLQNVFQVIVGENVDNLPIGSHTLKVIPEITLSFQGNKDRHNILAIDLDISVAAIRFDLNLELASGHVIEDSMKDGPAFQEVHSKGIDWAEAIKNQPGVEITQEELEAIQNPPGGQAFVQKVDLTKLNRYIRLVVTKTPKDL